MLLLQCECRQKRYLRGPNRFHHQASQPSVATDCVALRVMDVRPSLVFDSNAPYSFRTELAAARRGSCASRWRR